MSGPEFFKAGKYAEGTSASDEGARLSWRALKWLVIGSLCLIAGVTVWAVVPKWVDVGSVETSGDTVLWVRTGGELRINVEQVSPGVAQAIRIRLSADMETVPPDAAHPRGFRVTKELKGSGMLQFNDLVSGAYAVKVMPGKGSTWLVTVKDHHSWWGLPW